MKNIAAFLLFLVSIPAFSQSHSISGNILREDGTALAFATAVLLNPADSTMVYYGISNDQGGFEIRNIARGEYLMQAAYMGYETIYKDVVIPSSGGNVPLVLVIEAKVEPGPGEFGVQGKGPLKERLGPAVSP